MKLPVVNKGITLTEVPNRIAVFFEIGNCTVHCKGCHSTELWDTNNSPYTDTLEDIKQYIKSQYKLGADAVVFMGGLRCAGLDPYVFIKNFLKPLFYKGYDICLYDGGIEDTALIRASIYCRWLKTGGYKETLGGLNNPNTNQHFFELENNRWLDKTKKYFQKENIRFEDC